MCKKLKTVAKFDTFRKIQKYVKNYKKTVAKLDTFSRQSSNICDHEYTNIINNIYLN